MLNAIAFGLAVGAGIQSWRVWPPGGPVTADALALVFCVGLVCAWFGGRSRRGGAYASASAVASADASASAVNTVQFAVFTGADPRDSAGFSGGVRVPSEAAPWFGPASSAAGQLEQLDSEEIRSILEEREETV